MEILLNKSKSKNSNNKDNLVGVDLKNTTRPLLFTDFKKTIDAYTVFEDERNKSENYRFVLTIKPYCTNVLINPFTEIVKDEGSENPVVVEDKEKYNTISLKINKNNSDILGKISDIDRQYMIQNTEYSKDIFGLQYKPGYDFFNNHILRNNSFKLVCHYTDSSHRDVFNTIKDYMRYENGVIVKYGNRYKLDELRMDMHKHLYDKDDILSFVNGDAINKRIMEENGWFGFKNNSSINIRKGNDFMYINHTLNNKKSCEFIDMYPDRTLFSFKPLLNDYKRRLEYNWDIVLTYPFLIRKEGITAEGRLKLLSVREMKGNSGEIIYMFRSFIKHNLKRGDNIKLFVNGRETEIFRVTNVGDLKNNNKDFYFYINNISIKQYINTENEIANEISIVKTVNGLDCEYYFRLFKKIPNLKYRKENLTEDHIANGSAFRDFIVKNTCYQVQNGNKKKDVMYDFTKEIYPLSFSNTIYNDTVVQYTFTDDVDLSLLKDHQGKPLTEVFFTVVKRNRGYDKWYYKSNADRGSDEVEFSHCFGKVTSGIPFFHEKNDIDEMRNKMGQNCDSYLLNNCGRYTSELLEDTITSDGFENKSTEDKEGIIHNGLFYGDIVEFNKARFEETILETVCHRFNTFQREYVTDDDFIYDNFQYDEIQSDDYDRDGFTITTYEINNKNTRVEQATASDLERPEGYMYKAHYRCPIKELGLLKQDSNMEISVNGKIKETKKNGQFVVRSNVSHNLLLGDIVYACQVKSESSNPKNMLKNIKCQVVDVKSKLEFVIEIIDKGETGANINEINYRIRKKNYNIPDYAIDVGHNRFLWRDVQKIGNLNNESLIEYPFTNNAFYINKEVNFYLKRQDGDGDTGLYVSSHFPQDATGNVMTESNYSYKDDKEIIC